jgi:hypothetical protein
MWVKFGLPADNLLSIPVYEKFYKNKINDSDKENDILIYQ